VISVIKADLDVLYEKVIKPCRKGAFIYLLCGKREKKFVKLGFKKFKIPYKRGIYSWKGIIIISSYLDEEYESYFDKIYRVV